MTNTDQEPTKSDELFDALLSSAVVCIADTAAELPIVENVPQTTDDIVMLSDDERDENGKLKAQVM